MKHVYSQIFYKIFFMIAVFLTGCQLSPKDRTHWPLKQEGTVEVHSVDFRQKVRYTMLYQDESDYQLIIKCRFIPKFVVLRSLDGMILTQGAMQYSDSQIAEYSQHYFGALSFDDLALYLQKKKIPRAFYTDLDESGATLLRHKYEDLSFKFS